MAMRGGDATYSIMMVGVTVLVQVRELVILRPIGRDNVDSEVSTEPVRVRILVRLIALLVRLSYMEPYACCREANDM